MHSSKAYLCRGYRHLLIPWCLSSPIHAQPWLSICHHCKGTWPFHQEYKAVKYKSLLGAGVVVQCTRGYLIPTLERLVQVLAILFLIQDAANVFQSQQMTALLLRAH